MVRQQRDYSCGLASLATLLGGYYGDPVAEEALLQQLLKLRGAQARDDFSRRGVSLADIALLARGRGYRAVGVDVAARALPALRGPVIALLRYRGVSHFTVLRGVDARGHVLLADPSWGNRQFSRGDFARLFATGAEGRGRLLIVVRDEGAPAHPHWFRRRLPRPLLRPRALPF